MIITNQIFLHYILKNIGHKDHDNLNHLEIQKFTHKTQQMYNIHNKCIYKTNLTHNLFNQYNHKIQCQCILINQLKCKMKYRFHITFSNTKQQKLNFQIFRKCQMPNAAESLQMTVNPYLMGGSSITSNKPLMVFTGTDPEYSVEDCLNAVTANLILNIGPEPINTPLHQNWIHRRTALIQTTLDGAAQKWFSVLPIEIKSDWKKFTQEFSKMFDSERNKQHQRVLCNEIRRLPNETIKQLAVQIETLVRKAYSLNTHDYKNTKMTEILLMTLTPQLRKIAIKKRASHPSSIRKPDLDFQKLVDKLEQAEITMKLEETENLKLQMLIELKQTQHI